MITDNIDEYRAKLILAVMGEAESCSFDEKYLVACVGWNRLRHPIYFNNIDKDFLGYSRMIKIGNPESRQAFLDCVLAVEKAEHVNPKTLHGKIYYFNREGHKPQTIVPVFRADFPGLGLKHTFFGINFSEVKNG